MLVGCISQEGEPKTNRRRKYWEADTVQTEGATTGPRKAIWDPTEDIVESRQISTEDSGKAKTESKEGKTTQEEEED